MLFVSGDDTAEFPSTVAFTFDNVKDVPVYSMKPT